MAIQLWQYFRVTMKIRHRLCGGVPKSPDVIDSWIDTVLSDESRVRTLVGRIRTEKGLAEGDTEAVATALKTETMAQMGVTEEDREALAKTAWNGFKQNSQGLYLEGRCAKACLKEAAAVISPMTAVWGLKNRVAERFFVCEDVIPLGVMQPTGSYESVVHIEDRFGNPVDALKRTDYVDAPEITFTAKALNDNLTARADSKGAKAKFTPEAMLEMLLDVGGELGLGAERSQSNGRFDVVSMVPCSEPTYTSPTVQALAVATEGKA